MQYTARGAPPQGPRAPPGGGRHSQPHPQSKKSRYFIALFDYDPTTMSPNPESCDEELPFSEGDTIKASVKRFLNYRLGTTHVVVSVKVHQ